MQKQKILIVVLLFVQGSFEARAFDLKSALVTTSSLCYRALVQVVPLEHRKANIRYRCSTLRTIRTKGCVRFPEFDSKCDTGTLAIRDGKCLLEVPVSSDVEGADVVDIFKAKRGDSLDVRVLDRLPPNVAAQAIVSRVFSLRDSKRLTDEDFEKPSFIAYRDLELQIAFKSKIMRKIVENGFLNQYQTGYSSAIFSPSMRLEHEGAMVGLNFANITPALARILPKYTFAPQKTPKNIAGHDYADGYGDVIAVLNDDLKLRSTFSKSDSLGIAPEEVRSFSWQQSNPNFRPLGERYIEGQVWGEIRISDVEYLLLGCYDKDLTTFHSYQDNETLNKAQWDSVAKKIQRPIYDCKVINLPNGGRYYTRGRLLHSHE